MLKFGMVPLSSLLMRTLIDESANLNQAKHHEHRTNEPINRYKQHQRIKESLQLIERGQVEVWDGATQIVVNEIAD